MKGKITIILMLAALLTSCNSNRNDLEKYNLKGKVWKVKETRYYGEEKFDGHRLYIFNEDGNLTETQQLDRKGKIEKTTKYSYDENGICAEITTYEDDKVVEKQVNQINNNQIKETQVFDNKGKLKSKYQYAYSGADISGGRVFNSDGGLHVTFQNKLSSGLLTKQIVKDSLEEISSIRIYERNKEGDIITQKIQFPKDTIEYVYTFQYDYDEKGNWLKQYQFDEDGKIDNILVRKIVYYDKSKVPKTDKDFIGMWFVVDDNGWFELHSNKKFDFGKKDKIRETGTWEIDTKQQILTFKGDDPFHSRKFKYDFEGYQMILFSIQGKEELRVEKR